MQSDPDFLNKKASMLIDKGKSRKDYEKAIKILDKVLQLDKENDAAWFNKGLALFLIGDKKKVYHEAISCLNKSKSLDKKNPEVWHYLGHCFKELEDYKKSIYCYSAELKLDSSNDHSWIEKGDSLLELGIEESDENRIKDAIYCYDRALKLNAKNDIALANKGVSLYHLKEYKDAIKWFDKSLKIDRNDEFSLHYKGHCLQEIGEHKEALKCLKKSINEFEDSWQRISLSYLALERYNDREAKNAFRKIIPNKRDEFKNKVKKNKNEKYKSKKQRSKPRNKVFIVHGHNHKVREMIRKFIRGKGLEDIVLEDVPSQGMALINKLEASLAEVKYAVVLLTPDDDMLARNVKTKKSERIEHHARQNVVLEYGLCRGKLGGKNVCLVIKGDVDKPSDLNGVGHIDLENSEWRKRLTSELKSAKLIAK